MHRVPDINLECLGTDSGFIAKRKGYSDKTQLFRAKKGMTDELYLKSKKYLLANLVLSQIN